MKLVNGILIAATLTSSMITTGFEKVDLSTQKSTYNVKDDVDLIISQDTLLKFEQLRQEKVDEIREFEILKATAAKEKVEEVKRQAAIEIKKQEFNRFVEVVKYNDVTQIDLRKPSGLSAELADEILKGTGLEGLGKSFVGAEDKFGVNAYYLMAHAAWESQWGKSNLARKKNNLFGYQAYDANPYHDARAFKTKDESIYIVAKYVSVHYLQSNGDHYNGPTLVGMNVKYATDKAWAEGIGSIMNKFIDKSVHLKEVQI